MNDYSSNLKVVDQILLIKKLNSEGAAIVSQTPDDDEILLYVDSNGDLLKKMGTDVSSVSGSGNNIVTDSTTARSLSLTDAGKYITFTNSSPITVTIPTNSSVAFPTGTEIYIRRGSSAGIISLSNVGVTVNGSATASTVATNGNFALKKKSTNEWDLI